MAKVTRLILITAIMLTAALTVALFAVPTGFDANAASNEKLPLTVRVVLNADDEHTVSRSEDGSELTVKEGAEIRYELTYSGFIDGDTEENLTRIPYVEPLPKTHGDPFYALASYGVSEKYEFIYVAARLLVLENNVKEKTVELDGEPILRLTGEFSPLAVLNYRAIGVSVTNPEFAKINAKIEYTHGTGLFRKWQKTDAFRVGLTIDGRDVSVEKPPFIIQYKISPKQAKKSLSIIALYDGNDTEAVLIAAAVKNGFLTFQAADLGEFVVLEKVRVLSNAEAIGIIAAAVAAVFVIILFASLFKRKF